MKRPIGWMLSLTLVCGLASAGVGAAGWAGNDAHQPATTNATMAADDSLALLPPSDVLLVLDANRLINDVLPKIKAAWPQQVAKPLKEIDDFTSRTGVDLSRIRTISIGFKMAGKNGSGAMILDGLALDADKLSALSKEAKVEQPGTISYKGKTIYLYKSPAFWLKRNTQSGAKEADAAPDSSSPAGFLNDLPGQLGQFLNEDTAFAQLDQDRVVLGDQNEVKAVIDAATGVGNPAGNGNGALAGALKETISTGVIRFAVNLPDSARQWLAGQDYFKDLAATQMILGAVDIDSELSLLLEAKLRTPSNTEAAKIEATLNGLLAIGKMMLGGNEEPLMKAASQLLNDIKLNTQVNDVSLGVKISRAMFDQVFKSDAKPAEGKTDK